MIRHIEENKKEPYKYTVFHCKWIPCLGILVTSSSNLQVEIPQGLIRVSVVMV